MVKSSSFSKDLTLISGTNIRRFNCRTIPASGDLTPLLAAPTLPCAHPYTDTRMYMTKNKNVLKTIGHVMHGKQTQCSGPFTRSYIHSAFSSEMLHEPPEGNIDVLFMVSIQWSLISAFWPVMRVSTVTLFCCKKRLL